MKSTSQLGLKSACSVFGDAADGDQRRGRAADRLGDLAARAAGDVAGGIGLPDAALLDRAGLLRRATSVLYVRTAGERLRLQLVQLVVAEDRSTSGRAAGR